MRREGAIENTLTSSTVTSRKLSSPTLVLILAAPALRVGTDDQSCTYRRRPAIRHSDLVKSSIDNNLNIQIPRCLQAPGQIVLIIGLRDLLD